MKALAALLASAAFCTIVHSAAAQTITLNADPSNATILTISDAGVWTALGTGSAKFKLRKDKTNRVWVVAEGYDTLSVDFEAGKKYPKQGIVLSLDKRLVKVTALPYDAGIYVNGELKGQRVLSVKVPKGQPVTVEIRKPGFKPETRTYRFEGTQLPPDAENFELKDRLVRVETVPSGGTIKVDETVVANGAADVVVPFDKCVTVKGERDGYSPKEIRFCNREGMQPPTLDELIRLDDRMVTLTASPATANIKVAGRVVAQGIYNLLVPAKSCASVTVAAASYASQKRTYCDSDNPPARVNIDLPFDEAYTSSVQSDQANVNFTIEVTPKKSAESAWSTISQVVLGKFDVLEITDKETGYMRTAWEVTKFQHSVVRTRVIVKIGSTAPLKYVVKVASEYSDEEGVTVKDDEKFQEWDRLLNSYKDIINEMQARLR